MPLPDYPRVIFRKPPIRLALAQVRFQIMLRFADAGFIAPFQESIRDTYPKVAKEQQFGAQLTPRGLQALTEEFQWRFTSRDDVWSVVLGEGSLSLEVRQYESMDRFADRFRPLLLAAREHLGVSERGRFGLRFINEFRHPDGSSLQAWAKLLRSDFVGFAGSGLLEGDVEHMIQELRVRCPNGTLSVRHGLLTGTVVPDPRRKVDEGPFYLLDLDYYVVGDQPLDVDDTIALMREYNDKLYRFFRWAAGDGVIYRFMEPDRAE